MKRKGKILLLFISIFILLLCSACDQYYRQVENPYLTDRTVGWTCSVRTRVRLLLDGSSLSDSQSILRTLLGPPPVGMDSAIIKTTEDAANAARELISVVYGKTAKTKKMNIRKDSATNLWTIVYESYVIIFDVSGKLIVCTDLLMNDKLQQDPKDPFAIYYEFDAGQILAEDFPVYETLSCAITPIAKGYLQNAGRTEHPSLEWVYLNSLTLANIIRYGPTGYESDEFRAYESADGNEWVVVCCRWTAFYSKQTGELLFLSYHYNGFDDDHSLQKLLG